jgi:hypothetical protein
MWPRSIEVYDQMRRQDSQVMSVLRAVTLPILRTPWRVDRGGAKSRVTQFVADDLGLPILGQQPKRPVRTKDRFIWSEHLRLALLELVFGHSFFEQVYRIGDDGHAHLQKLMWLPPRTIHKLEVARDGGLVYLEQHPIDQETPKIPVENLVAYVNDREGGNWLGQSLLRPAYKFWLLKDKALRTQAMSLDRNGLGVPVYTASEQPENVTGDERIAREQAEIAEGSKLAQNYRAGDNSGAAIPGGSKLDLLGVRGTLPNADPQIRYHDEQIARAVLAHFLNLGTETGSWALGSTFADFFTLSLQTVAQHLADIATAHIVEDLVDINFGEGEQAPRIVFDEIGSSHPATAEAIERLVRAGVLSPDEALEHAVRTTYGLPEADLETRREVKVAPAPVDKEEAA